MSEKVKAGIALCALQRHVSGINQMILVKVALFSAALSDAPAGRRLNKCWSKHAHHQQ